MVLRSKACQALNQTMFMVLKETDMEFVPRKHIYLVSFVVKSK